MSTVYVQCYKQFGDILTDMFRTLKLPCLLQYVYKSYPCFHVEDVGVSNSAGLRLVSPKHHDPVLINTREGEVYTRRGTLSCSGGCWPCPYIAEHSIGSWSQLLVNARLISADTHAHSQKLSYIQCHHTHTYITHSFTHMWQSRFEYYSVAYFELITKFDAL